MATELQPRCKRHDQTMVVSLMPTPAARAETVIDQRRPCRYCKTKTMPRPGRAGRPTACSVCGRPYRP